jgi:hypothetical protein
MSMLYDCFCEHCHTTWEAWCENGTAPLCNYCGSAFTNTLPGGVKDFKANDPYDYLRKGPPDSKRIFSGPKVHSK